MLDDYRINPFHSPYTRVTLNLPSSKQLIDELSKTFNSVQHKNRGVLVDFKEIYNVSGWRGHTHEIHRYPAKMIPHIVLFCLSYSNKHDIILDPFCGSGSVLLGSKLNSRNSYGVDINPLCKLITKVKTTPIDVKELKKETTVLLKRIKSFNGKTDTPDFQNIDYWFTKAAKTNLSIIRKCIGDVEDPDIKDFFMACFSSIIRRVSKADPRIAPSVKSKRMREILPSRKIHAINEFKKKINLNTARISDFTSACDMDSFAKVIGEDAKNINLSKDSVDLVATSPPYLDAQKYTRSMRLELFWLGLVSPMGLPNLDKEFIGTDRVYKDDYGEVHYTGMEEADEIIEEIFEVNPQRAYIISKYFDDMKKSINETYRVLKDGGRFILVIGNNTVHGRTLPNHNILCQVATDAGFNTELVLVDYIKSRALMTKRNKTAGIINSEWIFVFRR